MKISVQSKDGFHVGDKVRFLRSIRVFGQIVLKDTIGYVDEIHDKEPFPFVVVTDDGRMSCCDGHEIAHYENGIERARKCLK